MKHKLHINKTIHYASVVLLLLAFAFTSIGATSQSPIEQKSVVSQAAISNYLAAQQNADLSDEEKIKTAIDAYFTIRYESQKLVKTQDFSVLVEDNNLAWVNKEKDKREIELYIAALFDIGYQSYKYRLDYDSIEINKNEATIQLRESHQVVFNAMAPEPSSMANLKHIFTLHNNKNGWVINKDEYRDELSYQIVTTSKEDIKKKVNENYQIHLDLKKQNSSTTSSYPKISEIPETSPVGNSLVTYGYDRNEASCYADTHTPHYSPYDCPECQYNTDYYVTESIGGDCTNFVSQALYAGGGVTPLDTRGMTTASNRSSITDWYYVFVGTSGTPSGSAPWIRVEEQKTFITTNTNKIGPVGFATTSLCNVQKGDVVQVKDNSSSYNHEGIIVNRGNGGCSNYTTTWLDAHMTDRLHYPLAYWSSLSPRYIMIAYYRSDLTSIFTDVQPTHWAWGDIEVLYNSGITAGCATNPLRYCPETLVTRAQMAVFLLRGIHGYNYIPPGAIGVFADVPTNYWAADWIEQLASEGITVGCGGGNYCPEEFATHAQMAVFLLRSKNRPYAYTPPDVGGWTPFHDVSITYWAAAWIKELAAEGISNGAHRPCTIGYYYPEDPVTRAEMAGMLLRTFNLP